LRQFESASARTVDGFAALATEAERIDAALQAEDWASFDQALTSHAEILTSLIPALDELQGAENGIQAELAGAPASAPAADTGSPSSGLLGTMGRSWSYTRELMEANERATALRRIMNDPNSTWEQTQQAQQQLWGEKDIIATVAKTTTGTMVGMGVGTLATTTVGRVVLSNTSKAVYVRGMTAITGSSGCAGADPQSTCVVTLERTADDGSVAAPSGTSSIGVAGDGKARVRADSVETSEAEPGEMSRDLIPIDEATPDNVTHGDEPEPAGADAWLVCERTEGLYTYYGCVEVVGGYAVWVGLSQAQKGDLCVAAGYSRWAGEHVAGVVADPEAACRQNCADMGAASQYYECDTPPP
jgi:hypothetical protein